MDENSEPARPVATGRRCPICGKPATAGDQPFCSPRCHDVDLHRWLGGHYAIPVADDDERDGAADPSGPPD